MVSATWIGSQAATALATPALNTLRRLSSLINDMDGKGCDRCDG